MTIKFECNKCGKIMDYDADKMVLLNVPDNEASAHLCPECSAEVIAFANQAPREPQARDRSGRFKK